MRSNEFESWIRKRKYLKKWILLIQEYTTVGGWVIENLERFAKKGDTFDFANLTVTVLKADEFTVEKVMVEVEEDKDEEEE